MIEVKFFWAWVKPFAVGAWGLNTIDLLSGFDFNFLKGIDDNMKLAFSFAGLMYFIVQIIFKTISLWRTSKYERIKNDILQQDLVEKLALFNELKDADEVLKFYKQTHSDLRKEIKKPE
tara:strand:+ start:738 stop:1094 length:357 start_codon:yes stop_codon:yes gene_type:complete